MTQIPREIMLEDWKCCEGNRREKLSVKVYWTSAKSKLSTAGVKFGNHQVDLALYLKHRREPHGKVSIIKMYEFGA